MKTKCSSILKVTTALVLAVLMMVGSISTVVGATISPSGDSAITALARGKEIAVTGANADLAGTGAATIAGSRIYFDNSLTQWSSVYIYIGHTGWAKSIAMTSTGYHNIYYYSVPSGDAYTDRTGIYFSSRNDSPNGQNYGIDTQNTWPSNNQKTQVISAGSDAGALFTPSAASNGSLSRSYPRVVAGESPFCSTAWSDCEDIMSATSTPSKTYENVAAGTYKFAVVGFYNDWSPAYRWAAKGTLTANNIASWADAGDGDHNIKLTTTAKSNVTITLNSSNKVDITVTPVSTTYTGITAVRKGTTDGTNYTVDLGTVQSSTSVNSSTGLSVSAGTQTNYTFVTWVASGSGTFASATSASTTFYPAANNEVATARYKRTYSVTKNSPSNGTITLSKSSGILAGETFKVTLAPSSGYRVATFTVDNVDKKSSLNSSNEYTHTATGTGTTFTVNATFEAIPGTTIYIKKTMPTFSYAHLYDPDHSDANLSVAGAWPGDKFTDWSTTTDGKYYYKTYTWNCSHFKMILNDNGSNQTGSGGAVTNTYATGKSWYIDTATNGTQVTLIEGTPSSKAISYTSTYASSSDVTWGGDKPSTAYPGESVSFTVSAKSGYRLDSVTYTPAGGSATTITATSGTYTFTMPSSAVTVTANTVKRYTVTLTAGTGIASKKYAIGSGSDETYSSAFTVDSGSTVALKVTYTTGYEYDSSNSTLDGATASNSNKTFTLSNITANKSVTIAAKKITWSGLSATGKYSTTGASGSYTNTWSSDGPNVTIDATSATQLDGVAVTAPATDPTGYVFAGWYTANGSFANAADKDTTFKPNAANAQAVATYKKIYTITASVDNTGTGAGAAPTINITSGAVAGQTNKLVAGGSYTVTASPTGSYSELESITVNNNATTTSPRTVNTVSADQTVVVKYKSKVVLKGKTSPIGDNWGDGFEMQSNAAGTEFSKAFTNVPGASGGTEYQFKLNTNGSWSDDGSATITITGGTSTGTCTHQSSGDKNYVLTLKKECNVTIVSDGAKITSITVRPTTIVQKAITFKQVAGVTITGTYDSTPFSTASGDATVQVYQNDDINFTVTAASGKYISGLSGATFTPAFSVADTYTGKIANVTDAATVTPTAANKFAITPKTNKSSRGTVSVSPASARPGETVTITVSPKAGVLQSLTYSYAGGNTYTRNFTANTWDVVTAGTAAAAPMSLGKNIALAATGAAAEYAPVGADTNYTFTLDANPTGAITVNATYGAYSAESAYYYNGYQSATDPKTSYWGKQMTEGMINGEKFSYYHVEGRGSENYDQYFTVSNGLIENGTRYVYFTQLKSGGWDYSHSPYAYFIGGSVAWHGTQMDWYCDNDMGQPVYRTAIPAGATGVVFNDGNTHKSTDITDLSAGGYYVDEYSTYTDGSSVHAGHTYDCSYPNAGTSGTGTEYKWGSGVYVDNFYTGGFYDQGSNVAKPKDGNGATFSECKDDYYIVVLYPGKTYTIDYNGNSATNTVPSDKPYVLWMKELPGDDDNVKVYAKDGSIRSESYGSTYANIADTKIYAADGTTLVGTKQNGSITNQTYETYNGGLGDTIVIKTQIGATDTGTLSDAAALKAKYFVRGFCVNGEVSQLLTWNSDGLYTLTYKIPDDNEDLKKIEITPIYYLKDTTTYPVVTYRVTGFTDELKQVGSGKPNWGDTLYTYPYYGKLGSQNNALGAYPGQPMVYYKGQYQMQIPQKSTAWDVYLSDSALSGTDEQKRTQVANTTVSGVTMSNGYYDLVHRQVMGYGNNSVSSDHVQTYDYGDFYKIFREKSPVDNIVYDFKYKTAKHNFENQPSASTTKSTLETNYGTGGNGFELLTNFHGRHVDLFGTPLSGDAADPSKTTPVYVISIGGVNGSSGVENIAGYYATEWMVYGSSDGSSYNRITGGNKQSIPPEVLVLNNKTDSFNNTVYPSAVSGKNLTDWQALYTNLEAYRGKPVYISYEAADAQQGQGQFYTGTGGATRNDGRWLYSKNGETITSKIRVDVSEDNGVSYTPNTELGTPVADLEAYFTNAEADGETTYTTTIDPDKTFDFEAHSNNADYKFMGWYMADGTKITPDNIGHTERSGSYTFVARFMHFTGGQLILGHKAATDTTYKGAGTATIAVTVKNGDEIVREWAASSSDVTIDDRIINNENAAYTIEVTLNASATGEDSYARTTCDAANTFFGNQSAYTTMPQTFSFTVGSLFTNNSQTTKKITYSSFFNQVQYSYNYTFNFTARDGSSKSYVREGILTAAQREAYVTGTGSESRVLTEAFVNNLAPHESNFNQSLKWVISASDRTFTKSGNNYTLTKSLTASPVTDSSDPSYRSSTRTATFVLPYAHNSTTGAATEETDGKVIEATTTNFVVNNVNFGTIPEANSTRVTAPRKIFENSSDTTGKFFRYWSIASSSAVSVEVARCYFNEFNMVLYDNYVITPVYGETATDISESGTNTSITYLDTTRNQFNGNGSDTPNTTTGRNTAADLLYNDFVLNYNYGDVEIHKNDASSSAITQLGFVVERVQKLDVQQDGTPYTDPNHYSCSNATTEQIEAFITSGTNTTGKTLTKQAISKDALDNKDRIEIYDAFYNSGGWNHDEQEPVATYGYKNYVYKAYSYMIVSGTVVLSSPVYFTMYAEATK